MSAARNEIVKPSFSCWSCLCVFCILSFQPGMSLWTSMVISASQMKRISQSSFSMVTLKRRFASATPMKKMSWTETSALWASAMTASAAWSSQMPTTFLSSGLNWMTLTLRPVWTVWSHRSSWRMGSVGWVTWATPRWLPWDRGPSCGWCAETTFRSLTTWTKSKEDTLILFGIRFAVFAVSSGALILFDIRFDLFAVSSRSLSQWSSHSNQRLLVYCTILSFLALPTMDGYVINCGNYLWGALLFLWVPENLWADTKCCQCPNHSCGGHAHDAY